MLAIAVIGLILNFISIIFPIIVPETRNKCYLYIGPNSSVTGAYILLISGNRRKVKTLFLLQLNKFDFIGQTIVPVVYNYECTFNFCDFFKFIEILLLNAFLNVQGKKSDIFLYLFSIFS